MAILSIRGTIILFFGLLTFGKCQSQSIADSLRNLIHETDQPKNKIDLQNYLAAELLDNNLEESFQTSSRALLESRKINYKYGEGWALSYQSLYFQYIGQPKKALELNLQALALAKVLLDVKLTAFNYLHCGRVYRDLGLLDSTYQNYLRAENIQKTLPDFEGLWQIYSSFSRYYLLIGDQTRALESANRAVEMAKLQKQPTMISYALLDVGDCYRDMFKFNEAKNYYNKALQDSAMINWLKTDYQESIGQLYFLEGDFDKAFASFSEVISAYEIFDGRHTLAGSLIKMAQIMSEKGLYNIAMEYLIKALKISEDAGYKAFLAEIYYEMARVNHQVEQLNTAMRNTLKAEELYTSLNNRLGVAGCFSMKGIIYLKRNQFDSALYFHKKGFELRTQAHSKTAISSSMFNIGDVYLAMQKNDMALDYFEKGLKYEEEIGDFFGISQYKNRIGSIYLIKRDYEKAQLFLTEALELAKQSSSFSWLGISYSNLAALHEAKGDFKQALVLRKEYEKMNSSSYNIGTAQSLASYRTLFEINQKDQVIEMLNKDKLIQQDEIRLRNILLYGVLIVALVLALLLYVFYHYSTRLKRLNNEIQEQNEEIQTQSEELKESNDVLSKLNEEITKQREEIRMQAEELQISNEAIARINEGLEKMVEQRTTELRSAYQELDTFFYRSSHDFRRPLTTLMGLAEVAKLSVKDKNALELFEKVSTTAVNLDKMLLKLQSISDVGSHQLVFKEVLLKQIIENALEPYRSTLLDKQARVSIDVKLPKSFISYPVLVKIMMENLIENAITFCNPEQPHVFIRAQRTGSTVIIEIEDNGEGIKEEVKDHVFEMFFRGSERSMGNGLGLYIARKAVEKISGKISFANNADRPGTTFKVEIPDQG